MKLASYAVTEHNTQGRQYPVIETPDRDPFQRDYTRVLHCSHMRLLRQKTQVFPSNAEGDKFRTRYDHSMEVDQNARAISRMLGLNESLSGTLAIVHDLGHAPFGHLGQDTLNELMQNHGGFEHNVQALRIVDKLESPYYPEYEGLNLMFASREGILKHCSVEDAIRIGNVAARHLPGQLRQSFLESQVVDLSDAISYVHSDLEDAFTMRLLTMDKLKEAPGFMQSWDRIQKLKPSIYSVFPTDEMMDGNDRNASRYAEGVIKATIRGMLSKAINDVASNSRERIFDANIKTHEDARNYHENLVQFTDQHYKLHKDLKRFSKTFIYEHPRIDSVRDVQKQILVDLFNAYEKDHTEMSGKGVDPQESFHRSLADHISGMTDTFALKEHARLLENRPDLIMTQKVIASKRKKPSFS